MSFNEAPVWLIFKNPSIPQVEGSNIAIWFNHAGMENFGHANPERKIAGMDENNNITMDISLVLKKYEIA